MKKRIIIIAGSGFAGMWAAISAARLVHREKANDRIEIFLVSPEPALTIRPRLYEAVLENMAPSILHVLEAAGVHYIAGYVTDIDAENKNVQVIFPDEVELISSSFFLGMFGKSILQYASKQIP